MTIEYDPNDHQENDSKEGAGGGGHSTPNGADANEGPYRTMRDGEEVDPNDVTENTVTREPLIPVRIYGK